MRTKGDRLLVLLSCLALALVILAAKGGPPQETPVSVRFRDALSDRIQSDDGGAYNHGVDGVRAVLVANGNLALKTHDTNSAVVRELLFGFQDPVPPNTTIPFGGTIEIEAFRSTSGCDGGLRGMTPGSSQYCNFGGHFAVPGTKTQWFVRFASDDYPDTTNVLVSRLSATEWEIEAFATDIAKLLSAPTTGKLVLTDQGNYYMPTKLTVTLLQ